MAHEAAPHGNTGVRTRRRFALELPLETILKGLAVAVAAIALLKVWPEVKMLGVAVLLAVALEPVVQWLTRHRWKRGWAVGLISVLGLLVLGGLVALVVPPTVSQVGALLGDTPKLMEQLKGALPQNPIVDDLTGEVTKLAESGGGAKLSESMKALSGLAAFGLTLIVAVYLLLDGRRLLAWLLAFVPLRNREKASKTAEGVGQVVREYVRGQAITSSACTVFSAILLTVLGVPAALPLAVLAGVCDILPVIGFFIAVVPAVLLALTVSPTTAIIVAVAYTAYQLFESYVLIPRVYGKMMRLSELAVLLAIIIGGALQGVWGAVMALPLVAAYPVVEKYWLRRHLGEDTVEDHEALDREQQRGKSDRAVEAVLDGDSAH